MWPWGQLSEREQKVTGNVLEREYATADSSYQQ
jgi:hypothetical protein